VSLDRLRLCRALECGRWASDGSEFCDARHHHPEAAPCDAAAAPQAAEGNANPMQKEAAAPVQCVARYNCDNRAHLDPRHAPPIPCPRCEPADAVGVSSETPSPSPDRTPCLRAHVLGNPSPDVRDAERYRWLRRATDGEWQRLIGWRRSVNGGANTLDRAIDTAIAKERDK
jgi:hypothetical protein